MLQGTKYTKNARKISEKQKADLKRWLSEFGDLGGIVLNVSNNQYVGGNQRSEALKEGNLVISERFYMADAVGTVAYGYVELESNRFAYREVQWDEDKHARASLIANKAGGEWDMDLLRINFADILNETGFNEDEIKSILDEEIALPEEEETKPIFEIVPKFSEKHDAIVIICDNELDLNFLKQVLGLEAQQSYKNTNVGTSFVITAQQFTRAWNKSQL